jgi:uncharacterized protein YwqG
MGPGSDRRRFFGELLREAAGVIREVNTAMRDVLQEPSPVESEPWYETAPVRAHPASHTASLEELAALCDAVGLSGRCDQVLALAKPSLRLTGVDLAQAAQARSYLGGVPDVPADFVWPTWNERALDFIGQIDLAEAAANAPAEALACGLPASGLLLFFYSLSAKPSGLSPDHRGSSRTVYVNGIVGESNRATDTQATLPSHALQLSWELTLPRSWSTVVERLELDHQETEAWETLREQLATAQGVDLEELSPRWQALHRLLGYPDELGSDLELDCELVTGGVDLAEGEEHTRPQEELEQAASTWRLLLQVSEDDELGLSLGDTFSRLYLLISDADLRRRDFVRSWAILR